MLIMDLIKIILQLKGRINSNEKLQKKNSDPQSRRFFNSLKLKKHKLPNACFVIVGHIQIFLAKSNFSLKVYCVVFLLFRHSVVSWPSPYIFQCWQSFAGFFSTV